MTVVTARSRGYTALANDDLQDDEELIDWPLTDPVRRGSETSVFGELEERFGALRDRWRRETVLLSSVHDICTHEAYQRIIGLGEPALPLILRELEHSADHWFWALRAITGETPEGPDVSGDLAALARVWTNWGRDHGLL